MPIGAHHEQVDAVFFLVGMQCRLDFPRLDGCSCLSRQVLRYIASSRIIYALDGYQQRLVGLLWAVAPQYFPVHAHGQKRQAFWGV